MPLLGSTMPGPPQDRGSSAKRLRKNEPETPFMADSFAELQVKIVSTIALVLDASGAIHFGMTTDGGALLVRCWLGGDKFEDYCTSPAEFADTLEAVQAEAEGAMHRKPSTGAKARKNGS